MTSSFTFGQARTYSIDGPRFAGLPPAFNGFPIQSLWVWLDLNSDGWTDYLGLGGYFPNEGSAWTPRPGFLAFGTASGYRLATAAEFPNPLLNVHAREVAVADFNGDGAWDIYIADHGYDAMPFPGYQNGLVLSTSPGRWIDATSTLPQVRDFTHSVSAGDLNGDGFQDLVVGNMGAPPNDVYVLLGDGRGGFRADTTLLPVGSGKVLDRTVRQVLASTVQDLDGDGAADLVLGTVGPLQTDSGPLQVLWNRQGKFDTLPPSTVPYPRMGSEPADAVQPHDIAVTDVNFDGRPDLLAAYLPSFASNTTGWHLRVYLNEGEQRFVDATPRLLSQPSAASLIGPTGGQPLPWILFLKPHDINGDGRQDFFVEMTNLNFTTSDSLAPLMLLQRPLGGFDVVTVADAAAAGLPRSFFNPLTYAERGAGRPGELSFQGWGLDGTAQIYALPISFPAPSSRWQGGGPGSDTLRGGPGADWLGGFGGDDRIEGGAGIDLARFAVPRSAATLTRTNEDWQVFSSAEGRDNLTGIERLWFSDSHVALDVGATQSAGQTALLIGAVLPGKLYADPSKQALLGSVISLFDQGFTLQQLSGALMRLPIWDVLTGKANPSNSDIANYLLTNVKEVAPSASELQSAAAALSAQTGSSQGDFLAQLAGSEANQVHVGLVGLATTGLVFAWTGV